MSRTSGGRMQEAHWKLILEGSKWVGSVGVGVWSWLLVWAWDCVVRWVHLHLGC
jgi:hypothetical protein